MGHLIEEKKREDRTQFTHFFIVGWGGVVTDEGKKKKKKKGQPFFY